MSYDPVPGVDTHYDHHTQTYAPSRRQKIRSFTVICLVINRTIGHGIFVTPSRIIQGTGSVGISLIFWVLGGVFAFCGMQVWLEFGLSIPRHPVEGITQNVPRSGGEKNYLEHVLRNPKFLATCMYGIVFIILGNLSGNAIAFGSYIMAAAGYEDPDRGAVLGLAVAALSAAVVLHVCSRRGGIMINNIFAVYKILIFLIIIVLGFTIRGGRDLGGGNIHTTNFDTKVSFGSYAKDVSSYSNSFLYVLYAYSGFEQPFYVLSEVDRPKKNFPKAMYGAMALTFVLFILVNFSYLSVVQFEDILSNPSTDIATLFFERVFGTETAGRVMAGAIALSILGNIVVMTFTASRVKQEIAKEGILPWSLVFATGRTTPDAWLRQKWQKRRAAKKNRPEPLEQAPMAGLALHYVSSLFLLAVTAMLEPTVSYFVLVSLYSYVMVVLMGFLTSTGLLYMKLGKSLGLHNREWVKGINTPFGPFPAIFYSLVCGFLLITAFLRPSPTSPFARTDIRWFIVPAIGLSTPLWGVLWWLGLHAVMKQRGLKLVVTRFPYCEKDDEGAEWVMKHEIVDHSWRAEHEGGGMGGGGLIREGEFGEGGDGGSGSGDMWQRGKNSYEMRATEGAFVRGNEGYFRDT
ncbi:amino acid transporter [Aulographum hederae CBS 113979]|uniref:Amino acid transporter n=1 Tax=Aulographum hederae CBS 113979 TaxID=1176131 RepID=A0A6G1GU68_9PEZI|nr:amino acid transporter [Aulographum hederae CBS 113979]